MALSADTVVSTLGYRSNTTLYEQRQQEHPEVCLLGDARRVASVMNAIWDAYEVARTL